MIQIINYRGFIEALLKAIIKLCFAGLTIGFLKSYDTLMAIILLLKIFHVIYKNMMHRKNNNWILIIGMLITSFGGMIGENWGVSNQYWEYHKVSNKLPLWLPFAWMLAFYFLDKVYLLKQGRHNHVERARYNNYKNEFLLY